MRFAVLADTHIGRSIPLAIAEHRREAFNRALTRAVDLCVERGVDYVFIGGDLFERRTLRPHLVQFVHDELYRLARMNEERHGLKAKILVVRGNHDGRPQSDTLDYIKHPLADYSTSSATPRRRSSTGTRGSTWWASTTTTRRRRPSTC